MGEQKPLIGFIGQGYIGKNYADDFEKRGYKTVRFSLDKEHKKNEKFIKECDFVFIAVPTPTTKDGFDDSIVRDSIALVKDGGVCIIKSTIIPDTTKKLQKAYSNKVVLYSPEFLSEATAADDATNPFSNIVGIPSDNQIHKDAAARVHAILPKAPFTLTCDSTEAEIIKYTHNASGFVQIFLFNAMYDLSQSLGCDWEKISQAIKADPLISNRYSNPVHKSGRGAGGNCFIKDFAALSELYRNTFPNDKKGVGVIRALECKNIELLTSSNKDIDLLKGVYGDDPEKICES
jgi:nucleotide sugar dehydrogenase